MGEYERAIDVLIASFQTRDFDRMRKELLRILTSLFEIHEIIDIHRSLGGKFDNELKRHLETYAKGPAKYTEEKTAAASNVARNIGFELILMAKLANAGIPLDFSIKSDVAAKFDGRSLLFECKRPQAESGLSGNIKTAFRQLEEKYQNPQRLRYRGLIAIDITKLFNPDFLLYERDDAEALNSGLGRIVDGFVARHARLWQKGRNKKTIAVLVRLAIIGVNKAKNNMFTYCQQFGVTPLNHVGERNIETARDLTQVLQRSLEHVV